MAFLPPNCVLDIMDKVSKDKELTEDESKLLSACAKVYKSSDDNSSKIFSFLGGFVLSSFNFHNNYNKDC